MAKRSFSDDLRQPFYQGLLWNRGGTIEVSVSHAEVERVRFKRFRPVVSTAAELPKLGLPSDWQVRLAKLLNAGAISYVYYSAKVKLDGLELGLPPAQPAERPAQFRRLRTHWNDGFSPMLQLGCFSRFDSSSRWLSVSLVPPLLFNSQSAWQKIECTQYDYGQLALLSLPGRTFVHQLLASDMVSRVVITPATEHYCDVAIGSLRVPSLGSSQVYSTTAQAFEDVFGLMLLE